MITKPFIAYHKFDLGLVFKVMQSGKIFTYETSNMTQTWKIFIVSVDTSLKNCPTGMNKSSLTSVTAASDIFNGNKWCAP